jgi:acetate kinase
MTARRATGTQGAMGERVGGEEGPILCINSGSSSLKLALFRADGSERILTGAVEGIGQAGGRAWLREGDEKTESAAKVADQEAATRTAFALLAKGAHAPPQAVGHRIVHGGPTLLEPVVIDDEVLAKLRAAIPFAPLHLPPALAAIRVAQERAPGAIQVACFDTGFHRDLPAVARRLPIPKALDDRGLHRYGFHGLSYEYIVSALGADARGRVIVAHLGSGASLAAIRDGRSIDTTMGLTPAGGVVMGTRTGDLDPGVLVFLMREGWDADAIERLIDEDSGLRGISGTTSDMKALLAARATDESAKLAVDVFCAQVRKAIGALATTLGGLDRLVFTGGIGERSADVRAQIARGLEHLGVVLDEARNARNDGAISGRTAGCDVRVIPTDEESVIAHKTRGLISQALGVARG